MKTFLPLKLLSKQFAGTPTSLSLARQLNGRLTATTTLGWQRNFSGEKHQTKQEAPAASASKEQIETPPQQEQQQSKSSTQNGNKELLTEIEVLKKDIATEKEKYNEVLDKYRRALADSENMRVRLNKQIQDAKIFGIQSFCKDMLEVADTLGHATQAVPKDKLNNNPDLKNLYEGLTMTRASLLQVFKRHGLEPVDPLNKKFDPNVHEALFQKEDTTVEPNTVIEVTKLGYKLHERCIRPALVGVSKC